jgi:AraC family transcriptional regulator
VRTRAKKGRASDRLQQMLMNTSVTPTSDTTQRQIHPEAAIHGGVVEANPVLRKALDPQAGDGVWRTRERLLAWQARKLREYIDSHLADPIRNADLCALIGLSQVYFARSFKSTFGMSPHAFVVRRRLELAAEYMLQTNAPLSDIAIQCGFSDQAHMSKRFLEATGWTPAAWIRSNSTPAKG